MEHKILHKIAKASEGGLKGFASKLGIPYGTFLLIIQGRRTLSDKLLSKAQLAFGISPESKSPDDIRDITGKPYPLSGFIDWWQDKALPYLSSLMASPQPGPREKIPAWTDNEAKLLKALLKAAQNQGRLPVVANAVRHALHDVAKSFDLEKQWEKEAQKAGVLDIRYQLRPVDIDKELHPAVSITSRSWFLNAPPVMITAQAYSGDKYLSTPKPKPKPERKRK